MMRLFSTKKRIAAAGATVALVAAMAGAAFAYFTASGSGNGSALVGNVTGWTVDTFSSSGGPMYPGSGVVTVSYKVTNAGGGDQHLNSIVPSVATDTTGVACTGPNTPSGCNANYGDIETTYGDNTTDVAGCLASWFSLDNTNHAAYATLAKTSSETGSVDVSIPSANVDQSACEGFSPAIHIAAS